MGHFKGSSIVAMREFIRSRGPEIEQRFYERLSPQGQELFKKALPVTWISFEDDPGDLDIAADLLFPGDPEGIRKVSREMIKFMMRGIYTIFVRMPSTAFIIKRLAGMWKANYDVGAVEMNKIGDKEAHIVIRHFPEIMKFQLESLCGSIVGILEMTDAQHIQVTYDSQNKNAIRLYIKWE